MPPTYYRGCWHVVSRGLFFRYRHCKGISSPTLSSRIKEFYNPKAFITHAALLRQAFAHCGRFPTAASRRSLDRVSVPVWPFILSDRLLIVGLVGRYPTNYLIRRKPLFRRSFEAPFFLSSCGVRNSFGISSRFRLLSPSRRQVVYALLTRSPLNSKKASFLLLPFDLHVLSTPPAFVLSQDQTLHDRLFVWLDFVLPLKQISLSLLKFIAGYFYPAHRHILFADYSVFKEPIAQCDVRYIITDASFCQLIFWYFSAFSQKIFCFRFPRHIKAPPLPRRQEGRGF